MPTLQTMHLTVHWQSMHSQPGIIRIGLFQNPLNSKHFLSLCIHAMQKDLHRNQLKKTIRIKWEWLCPLSDNVRVSRTLLAQVGSWVNPVACCKRKRKRSRRNSPKGREIQQDEEPRNISATSGKFSRRDKECKEHSLSVPRKKRKTGITVHDQGHLPFQDSAALHICHVFPLVYIVLLGWMSSPISFVTSRTHDKMFRKELQHSWPFEQVCQCGGVLRIVSQHFSVGRWSLPELLPQWSCWSASLRCDVDFRAEVCTLKNKNSFGKRKRKTILFAFPVHVILPFCSTFFYFNRFGRKLPLFIFHVIAGLSLLSLAFLPKKLGKNRQQSVNGCVTQNPLAE